MHDADTSRKIVNTIFQVLVIVNTWKIMDMSNYLYSYSSLTNLTNEYLEDTRGELKKVTTNASAYSANLQRPLVHSEYR